MPNRKLTKAGGREYSGTEGAQDRAPNSYEHICDPESKSYYRNLTPDVVPGGEGNEFPTQVPDWYPWETYNDNTHMGSHPVPTKPGDARFPPAAPKKI